MATKRPSGFPKTGGKPQKPTPKPTVKATKIATPKPKVTPKPAKTLPSMAEFRKSAAYNSMSYKEYLDSFRARGYK